MGCIYSVDPLNVGLIRPWMRQKVWYEIASDYLTQQTVLNLWFVNFWSFLFNVFEAWLA